jgi:nucleotide sugar dehydrogenase
MSVYKIGICGYGYVGRAFGEMFGDWVSEIYDPITHPLKTCFENCDLTIVCVPTAMKDNGQCDTSLVKEAVRYIKSPLILIKSTVEPGTTNALIKETKKQIAFSPEYIGEGKYFTPPWEYPDPLNPISHGFMVLGGSRQTTEKIAQIFVKKMGPHTKFTFLKSKEAECVKYWENIWGAMKVIFCNEMYEYLKALGVSYYRAREGWVADPRVERMHTAVFERARGFSGKCYPKDLSAFIYTIEQAGVNPELLKLIWNLNCKYRPDEFKPKK